MTRALIAPVSATLMPMQTHTLWRIRSYFWAPKFCPTKVVTETPKPTGVLHTLIYVVVMILLYIIGYMIQQRWVFAPQKQNEPEVEKK